MDEAGGETARRRVAPALWDNVPKSSPSAHEPLPPQAPVPPPLFAEVRQTGPEALVANAVTFLRRQPKPQGVFELLMKGSKPTAVVSPHAVQNRMQPYGDTWTHAGREKHKLHWPMNLQVSMRERSKALTVKSGTQRPYLLLKPTKRFVP